MNVKFSALGFLLTLGTVAALPPLVAVAEEVRGPEILVVGDAVSGGEEFRPSPGKPIYYIFSQTNIPLGDVVAGIKLPAPAMIEQAAVAELTKQGYVRTQVGGPVPSLLIIAIWGEANFTNPTDPADDLSDAGVLSLRTYDRRKMEQIVGTAKLAGDTNLLGAEMFLSTPKGRKVLAASTEQDSYYVSLVAFDAALFAKKQKRLLWRTSMSLEARNDFALALPAMFASGGPLFGRNVAEPAFLDDRDRRKFGVEIGEARVVPDTPESTAVTKPSP